ncbi:MAG: hypothetical protein GW905_13585 [Rhodobacterales bacterium]|nr:hypothetical protein [Rhodobacterales bacterium]
MSKIVTAERDLEKIHPVRLCCAKGLKTGATFAETAFCQGLCDRDDDRDAAVQDAGTTPSRTVNAVAYNVGTRVNEDMT